MALQFLNDGYFAGKVGIGTDSPSQKLEVEGTIRISKSTDVGSGLEIGRAGSSLDAFIIQRENAAIFFRTNNTERMRISSAGAIKFNAYGAGTLVTDASGNITAVGGGGAGPFLPLAGGTLTGDLIIDTNANALLTLDGGAGSTEGIIIKHSGTEVSRISHSNSTSLVFSTGSSVTTALTLDSSQNATFAGNITLGDSHFIGDDANDNLLIQSSANENIIIDSLDELLFRNSGTTNLTINGAGNANFAGSVTAGDYRSPTGNTLYITSGLDWRFRSTSGAERMRIDSSGNVGIGTTSPSYPFSLESATTGLISRIYNTNADGQGLLIRAGATTSATRVFQLASSNDTKILTVNSNGNVGIGTTNPGNELSVTGTGRVFNATSTSDEVVASITRSGGSLSTLGFNGTGSTSDYHVRIGANATSFVAYTFNTERMRIDTSGNVGIGTTSPVAKLHVEGNLELQPNWEIGSNTGSYWQRIKTIDASAATTNAFNFETRNGSGSYVAHMVVRNDGNVGIGTVSPNQLLEVANNAGGATISISTDQAPGSQAAKKYMNLDFTGYNNNVMASIQSWDESSSTGHGNLTFSTRNASTALLSQRMIIDYIGNVGIGTDSPDSPLHLSQGTSNTFFKMEAYATSQGADAGINVARELVTGSNSNMSFWTNTGSALTQKMSILANGNVGIGTDSPSQKLTISQNATGTGQGIPATTGTTQNGILRLEAGGTYGECLDMGMNVATTYAWIQPVNKGNLAVNYNLALNPNGGNVGIGTDTPAKKLHVKETSGTFEVAIFETNSGGSFIRNIDSTGTVETGIQGGKWSARTSNTQRLVIDSLGNVGIGTTSPGNKLVVETSQGTTFSDAFLNLKADATTDTVGRTAISLATSTVNNYGVTLNAIRQGSTSGEPRFGLIMHNNSASGTEAFSVRASGHVGIGETDPQAKLDVNGTFRANYFASIQGTDSGNPTASADELRVSGYGVMGNRGSVYLTNSDGNGLLQLCVGGSHAQNPKLVISSNNAYFTESLGIGTTSPDKILHIQTNGSYYGSVRIQRDSTTQGETSIGFFGKSDTPNNEAWVIGENGWGHDGDFVIGNENGGVGGNVRMLIQRDGNVGIGNTSPSQLLHVGDGSDATRGIVSIEGAGGQHLIFSEESSYYSGANAFVLTPAASTNFIVTQPGNSVPALTLTAAGALNIRSNFVTGQYKGLVFYNNVYKAITQTGATSDNTVNLGTTGGRFIALYATNGTIQTSDIREKTEIKSTQLGLDFVNDLNPVSYKWVDGKRIEGDENIKDERHHQGLIAQEVAETLEKHGVDKNEFGGLDIQKTDKYDDFHGMSYEQLVAPMIKAIQELKAEIDILKAK